MLHSEYHNKYSWKKKNIKLASKNCTIQLSLFENGLSDLQQYIFEKQTIIFFMKKA